ncbi:MAG TPA: hypothetical protein VIV40_00975 [Kofleriaceae bacterium]
MRSAGLVCLLLAGCSFDHGIGWSDLPDGPRADGDGGGSDTGCTTYSSLFDTCTQTMGSSALTLTGSWTYNTDTHQLTNGSMTTIPPTMVVNAAAGPIDIIFVSSFTLEAGATLRGTSPNMHRPFGIVSTGAIQIDGVIDVSSAGAGARTDVQCGGSAGAPGSDNNGGGGGGGGGAFRGKGGNGSKGNLDGPNANGGAGGTAIPTRPSSPIGGCDGGAGGGPMGQSGGQGGNGGGAVYLASATSITISATGVVDAGGHFGIPGNANGEAGGGGGSGGMILLESKTVTVNGIVVANGGGGGEGNTTGNPGESGRRSVMPALGGKDGDANGGDGGNGGAALENDGVTTIDLQNGGGGGGGGAAGFIAIACSAPTFAADAAVSPEFAPWP